MTRSLPVVAYLAGLAAIGWIGSGYVGHSPLALAVTLLIGAFYLAGGAELWRFDQATRGLALALAGLREPPALLDPWLGRLPAALRQPVRLRIDGERVGLPGPALAPYLAGLLVLLGMLGTFVGMVVTLRGTGSALEGAADLATIRASLSAPVQGLGLAFGTSIAGVAASAMLGLATALCRRDRLLASAALDACIAGPLRIFGAAHRRDDLFRLQQLQAEALPALVDRVGALTTALARQGEALNERLLAGQDRFHDRAHQVVAELTGAVDRSLQDSLTASARIAGAALQPVVETAMAGIARESEALHRAIAAGVERRLDAATGRFASDAAAVAAHWQEALDAHRRTGEALAATLGGTLDRFGQGFDERAGALADRVAQDTQRLLDGAAASLDRHGTALLRDLARRQADDSAAAAASEQQRLAAWTGTLEALAGSLGQAWQQAGAESVAQQRALGAAQAEDARALAAATDARLRELVAEVARLMQAAAEAPRAAAEAIAELRRQVGEGVARDNAMVEERTRLLAALDAVLAAVDRSAAGQQAAVEALVAGSADMLEQAGDRFAARAEAQQQLLAAAAAQVTGGAVELASLGDAFGGAVQQFGAASVQLAAQLERIEAALGRSTARSDEQLAYYVAQARELIDLSLLSQKQIVEDMQRLSTRRDTAASAA